MKRKKMETSKKIILASYMSAISLSLIVIIGTFLSYDVSDITMIASLSWAEVAASNIWYYKKAKKENVPKIIASMPEEFKGMIDINRLLND